MALTKTSAWSLGTVGLCVALSAASWFLLIEPERAEAAATRDQTASAEQSNDQLEVRIEQLKADFANLPAKQAELAAIRQALPEEPALASLVRGINEAATDTGVRVDGLTTGAVGAVVDPAAVEAVAEASTEDAAASGEPSAEPSASPSTEPADGASEAPAEVAGVTTVEGAPAGAVLASVPLTIETTASFYETNLLLKELQTELPRALLVDSFTMAVLEEDEGIEPGTVRTTFNARVFVFVDPDSVEAVDAPLPSTTD